MADDPPPHGPPRFLERVGLHRPELRAWALYDWANSAFVLVVQAAVFPIYFSTVVHAGDPAVVATRRLAWTNGAALAVVAAMAPMLGALADYAGLKKRFLGAFLGLGAVATGSLWFVQQGDWLTASLLFALATIGAQGSFVFYDSLLPHVARDEREMDRVSAAGFAIGYLGSSLLLVLQLAMILRPAWFGFPSGEDLGPAEATLPTRIGFVMVAAWWLVFSVPLFLRVREPGPQREADESAADPPWKVAFARLGETFRELRLYRQAFLMLIAFIIYNDGISTIIKLAGIYGVELRISATTIILSLLVAQLVGVPFALLFGALAGKIGAKRSILLGLAVYVGITFYAFRLRTGAEFLVLSAVVGMVQGGTQALSRSLFASMIPRHKSSEFFGFYGVLDKFAGIIGPVLFATTSQLTGSSRLGILTILTFFVVGALLLTRVRVEEGRQIAREAERVRLSG